LEKKIPTKIEEQLEFLNTQSFIRLSVLSPEQTLGYTPKKFSDFVTDGIIGLRTAVACGVGWSAVPAMSVTQLAFTNKVTVLKLPTILKDDLSLWWLRSRRDATQEAKLILKWLNQIT
jgi:DNA-binding transcriptional LysR family regulator